MALAILTIGIMGVIPMLALNLKANIASRYYGQALFLATQKIEQIKSWPYYDTVGVVFGIDPGNTTLFKTNDPVFVVDYDMTFNITSTVMRNGYDASGGGWDMVNCPGTPGNNSVIFDLTAGGSDHLYSKEYSGSAAVSLNTQFVEPCGTSGGYRGEDFKLVTVVVSWSDSMGTHSLTRQAYIARF